jgi:hypothetical protein
VIIVLEIWKLLTGRLADADLVGIADSEDVPHAGAPAARREPR